MTDYTEPAYTRRQYLVMRSINRGATYTVAADAVEKCIRNNPGWESAELKTYDEWEEARL